MSGSSFRWPTKKVCIKHLCTQDLSGSLTGLYKKIYIFFCFMLLFTSSSPCRKDQVAVSYFFTSLIVLIQVYNWEIRHHSLVCCCGLADILYISLTARLHTPPGSIYVSGKLPIYPSPKPTLTLTSHLGQNVSLGEG